MRAGNLYDYTVIKYSEAGVPLWTNLYHGPVNSNAVPRMVVVDTNDDVVVTGAAYMSGGRTDMATIKYASDGTPLWTNHYFSVMTSYTFGRALAIDGDNNIIAAGSVVDTSLYGGFDYATIKYSSSGLALWTNVYSGRPDYENYNSLYAVAVDRSNSVVVTGGSTWADYAFATVKYSSAGVQEWAQQYRTNHDIAYAVSTDSGNNVIVSGNSSFFDPQPCYLTIIETRIIG